MNLDPAITLKPQVGYQILTYLIEHPEAQDTLEGIVEWWLLERKIKYETSRVKDALSELIANGMLLERKGPDSQTHYRINQSRYEEIRELFMPKSN